MANPGTPLSSEHQALLDSLDQLIADLSQALADRDWDALASLNAQVKPTVKPLVTALEAGQLDPEPVRARLEKLRQFVDAADAGATQARAEAEQALKGMTRNRSAAKAYQNVSTNRPK